MPTGNPVTSAPLLGEPLPVELMNTIWADRDGVHDALDNPAGVTSWLLATEACSTGKARVTQSVAGELRLLRDALRALAAHATQDDRTSAASAIADRSRAIRVLNRASASAPAWSQLSWPADTQPHKGKRSTHAPADAAVSAIAEQAVELFAGPLLAELRACHAPGCVLYFVRDHPRREWCSAGCGNRARVARHYRRHRAANS
jgi:predicted RNA-binding Zn ribbon-like protein